VATYEEQYGPLTLPILAGCLPLQSSAHAEFLHNEVPGIRVPDSVRNRMREAGSDGRLLGVKLAQELLHALPEFAQGVYMMPPFGRYELVAEITSVVKRP